MAKKAARKAIAKRGVGRPPKDESERLANPIPVGFSDEQLSIVDRAIEASGVKRSEFIREAAMKEARRVLGE